MSNGQIFILRPERGGGLTKKCSSDWGQLDKGPKKKFNWGGFLGPLPPVSYLRFAESFFLHFYKFLPKSAQNGILCRFAGVIIFNQALWATTYQKKTGQTSKVSGGVRRRVVVGHGGGYKPRDKLDSCMEPTAKGDLSPLFPGGSIHATYLFTGTVCK